MDRTVCGGGGGGGEEEEQEQEQERIRRSTNYWRGSLVCGSLNGCQLRKFHKPTQSN